MLRKLLLTNKNKTKQTTTKKLRKISRYYMADTFKIERALWYV